MEQGNRQSQTGLPTGTDLQCLLGFKLSWVKCNTRPSKPSVLIRKLCLTLVRWRATFLQRKRSLAPFLLRILRPPRPVLKLNKQSIHSADFSQHWCQFLREDLGQPSWLISVTIMSYMVSLTVCPSVVFTQPETQLISFDRSREWLKNFLQSLSQWWKVTMHILKHCTVFPFYATLYSSFQISIWQL